MNASRIPTPAQHAWAQADTYARCQADGDSLRREFRADAREPVKHLRVVPDAEFNLAAVYSLPRPGEEGELAGSVTGRIVCASLVGIGVLLVAAIQLGAQ